MSLEISAENFYGKKTALQEKIEATIKNYENENDMEKVVNVQVPKFMGQLLGPSQTWKVFKKQQDAIDCCRQRRNGLMSFAFEDVNTKRMFLVAHPKVFWTFNRGRFFRNCSTYEIIQEFSACKLYLDIEYERKFNATNDGERMLQTLVKIINFNLIHFFGIHCQNKDILDLDSSTASKFSHHIIYEIKNVAFQNNYVVGNFIKCICDELHQAFEKDSTGDSDVRLNNLSKKYDLSTDLIKELFVQTEKQKFKLLVDEAVYTKNRHFRLFGSSKQRKKVPLVTSKSNEYVPVQSGDSTPNLCIFLDSLVTYFSWEVTRVLEFQNDKYGKRKSDGRGKVERTEKSETMAAESLIHPQVDIFIRNLISPNGRIRRKTFFSDSSTILYEITGFRYCDNIKREHKSNNIKYVVDLQVLGFYQKCYDPDCVDFRSAIRPLPDEIRFLYEEDSVFDGVTDITEIEDFWEEDEDFLRVVQVDTGSTSQLIDDGADDELSNVLDCTEAMLDMTW